MAGGDFCLLVFNLFYFGYYCIKFRVKLITEIIAGFKSSFDFLHKNISFDNWKKGLASILGIIIIVFPLILWLILLILKKPLLFLKKIVDYEIDNKFEVLKYLLFPMNLAYISMRYAEILHITYNSINTLINFKDRVLDLVQNVIVVLAPMLIILFFISLYNKLSKGDKNIFNELQKYYLIWMKLIVSLVIIAIVIVAYIITLEDLKNHNTQIDAYAIIPLFLASCVTGSKIIISLIKIVGDDKK